MDRRFLALEGLVHARPSLLIVGGDFDLGPFDAVGFEDQSLRFRPALIFVRSLLRDFEWRVLQVQHSRELVVGELALEGVLYHRNGGRGHLGLKPSLDI